MEWPAGWLKWEGTAAVAFAWSGLFVACLRSLKRSRNVHLVSPTYCLLHLLHWIIYVRFVESLVMWCLICLVSPVLLSVRWGSHVWSCDKRNVLAGGLDVLSMLASFARTSISRRFGERPKATAGCFIRKGYLFLEKWYIKECPCINHGKASYKGLELGTEPPRINICWVTPPGFPYTKCSCRAVKNISNKLRQCALNHNKLFGDFCRQIKSWKSGPNFFKFQSMSEAGMSILDWILCRADERSGEI